MATYDECSGRSSRPANDSWDASPERSGGGIVLLALAVSAVFGALGVVGIEVVALLMG